MSKTFAEIHITGEGFRRVSVYRLFFKAALREVRAAHEAYDAEVRDWYENGDGRPAIWATDPETGRQYNAGGKGHTFPHCIHGVSRWVDYDCACGWCEEGSSVTDEARVRAREGYLRFNDRWDWVNAAPGDLSSEERRKLLDWTIAVFPKNLTEEN